MNAVAITGSRKTWRFWHRRLGGIELGEQRFATNLPGNAHRGAERIVVWIPDAASSASVAVTEKDTAFLVHRDLIKVEQVPIQNAAAATLPDAAFALYWVVRR